MKNAKGNMMRDMDNVTGTLHMALVLAVVVVAGLAAQAADIPADPGWPRLYKAQGHEVILHQPQIDRWEKSKSVHMRAAVVIRKEGAKDSQVGVLRAMAPTSIDLETRVVFLGPRTVESLSFNDAKPDEVDHLKKIMLEALPDEKPLTLSLDRMLAALAAGQTEKVAEVKVNFDPPPIYVSDSPAVLVMLAGKPRFQKVQGTGLMFAANTNWDLFLDSASGQYYLLIGDHWLTTNDLLKGKWSAAASLPSDLGRLPDNDNWKDVNQNIPGKASKEVETVFVSTSPAELIVTDGAPDFEPIPGTKLMTISNTDSDLFLHMSEKQYYYLAAGRWFRSKELTGPWSPATRDLPTDFAQISSDHEAADVLVSVPGTPQAEEAVLQASTPRKATINRNEVTLNVVYQGDPKFEEIEQTTLKYAVNTPYVVVLADGKYYCCHEGVWFESASAGGPWAVCTSVPASVYAIPPSHPIHNVTYVYVYESTPTTVVVGSTGGYSGQYVAAGVVLFGAGVVVGAILAQDDDYWHYHYSSCYFSYGCGAHYSHYSGGYFTGGSVHYGPYGGAGAWSAYNPSTGVLSPGAYRYGPAGSASVRTAYNPWTGAAAGRAQVSTPYGSWGRGAVTNGEDWARGGYKSGPNGTVGGIQTSEGSGIVAGKTEHGSGAVVAKDKDGDVYVAKDGNAYKRDESGEWSKRENGEWKPAEGSHPTPHSTGQPRHTSASPTNTTYKDLDRQAQARDRSETASRQAAERPSQPTAKPTSRSRSSGSSGMFGGMSRGGSATTMESRRGNVSRSQSPSRSSGSSRFSGGMSSGGRSSGGRLGGRR